MIVISVWPLKAILFFYYWKTSLNFEVSNDKRLIIYKFDIMELIQCVELIPSSYRGLLSGYCWQTDNL